MSPDIGPGLAQPPSQATRANSAWPSLTGFSSTANVSPTTDRAIREISILHYGRRYRGRVQ